MTWVFSFDQPPELEGPALTALLGGKGANLAVMANQLELPVPPGFVITTGACKAFMREGWPEGLDGGAAAPHGMRREAGRPPLR